MVLQQLKTIYNKVTGQSADVSQQLPEPLVVGPDEHHMPQSAISTNALKVLNRLNEAGFQAHIVGGGVRDILSDLEPKDFDIATDAHPEQIKQIFRNCRLIGRRFRLAHIYFGREIIEVATFRGAHRHTSKSSMSIEGMIVRDNVYGTIEEDVCRRDFTINALYYNNADRTIIDYVGGLDDLKNKIVRLIGDPDIRYTEDPVRLLRCIRTAAKLDFQIDPKTAEHINKLAPLLSNVPPARLFDEILKLFIGGHAVRTYPLLQQYQLFERLFPQVHLAITNNVQYAHEIIECCVKNTDERLQQKKTVNPGFVLAALLWYPMLDFAANLRKEGMRAYTAFDKAISHTITEQAKCTAMPRRLSMTSKEIWILQSRFKNRYSKRAFRLLEHPRFRAAYDFLLLRIQVGEPLEDLGQWWTQFQSVGTKERLQMVNEKNKHRRKPHD